MGTIRVVQAEYPQDWLTTSLEETGQKQAAWRTDPAQTGGGGCIGDIGTHAFNLTEFVTGLHCTQIAADLTSFVPGRRVDDNVNMLLRFSSGARGMLWSSQVAPGHENGLRLRVYGDKAGIEWHQEQPNHLRFARLGEPPQLITRNGPGSGPASAHASRIPAGHPEGYLEGFAQIYSDMAEQITARIEGRDPDPAALLVPTVADGLRGVQFISAAVDFKPQQRRLDLPFPHLTFRNRHHDPAEHRRRPAPGRRPASGRHPHRAQPDRRGGDRPPQGRHARNAPTPRSPPPPKPSRHGAWSPPPGAAS